MQEKHAGEAGSIPGSGRSPEGRHGNPLQYSCLKIPWTEESGGLQSMGSQRVKYGLRTKQQQYDSKVHNIWHVNRQNNFIYQTFKDIKLKIRQERGYFSRLSVPLPVQTNQPRNQQHEKINKQHENKREENCFH